MWIFAFWIAAALGDVEGRQPQLAAEGSKVVMTYGVGNDVMVRTSNDTGVTWSDAVKLPGHGVMSLGMRRGPRVAIDGGRIVVSAIQGAMGRGKDGDIWTWRSEDGGKTFGEGVRANDVADAAREGLHAMAAGGGKVYLAWLDLRAKGTTIHGAVSTDGGKTWGKNELVYASPGGSVCECCHPSIAVNSKGEAWVMFRNSLDGRRDMYIKKWGEAGATKLGKGEWVLNACPMDGGSLRIDPKTDQPYTAWRREGKLFTATIGSEEKEIGDGKNAVAWHGKKGVETIFVRGKSLVSSSGKVVTEDGAFPVVVAKPDGTGLLAFERAGKIIVQSLD